MGVLSHLPTLSMTFAPYSFALFAVLLTGAEPHWSFQPIGRPSFSSETTSTDSPASIWSRGQVDRFTLERMTAHQFKPTAQAERSALIKRVTLDLTGIPPSWSEVLAFEQDSAPNAYERLVDRLLQSPRYGEHMAVPWLDLARYADTHGYHMDAHRDMWRWRDWVVGALNANMSFDQFTIEQLAGDMLPAATLSQQIASGFNRNHMINFEDGSIAEEFRTEYVADRVETMATVWLGLTMNCCRCHDHRYDPLTQEEYFRLFAFFNNVPEQGIDGDRGNATPFVTAPSEMEASRILSLETAIKLLNEQLRVREVEVADQQDRWAAVRQPLDELPVAAAPSVHLLLDQPAGEIQPFRIEGEPTWVKGRFGEALLYDGRTHIDIDSWTQPTAGFSLLAWVYATTNDEVTLFSKAKDGPHARGFDVKLHRGEVVLRIFDQARQAETQVASKVQVPDYEWHQIGVTLDGSGSARGSRIFIDGRQVELRVIRDAAVGRVPTTVPLSIGGPRRRFRGVVDDIRIYDHAVEPDELSRIAGLNPIGEILAIAKGDRSPQQQELLRRFYLNQIDAEYISIRERRRTASEELSRLREQLSTVMVMRDTKRHETFVLDEGRFDKPAQSVSAGVPACLPPLPPDLPANRLALARWLIGPRHPLTARVTVNRYWQHFFGRGLVSTPHDFGTQGSPPTHPELLDWLATEFIQSGWDVKALHRQIVTSSTYRQSNRVSTTTRRRDAENHWLARGPSGRLSGEVIRDSALAISGLLVEKLGGPGVFPYQPDGLWRELSYDPDDFTAQVYTPGRGSDLYRRSLHTFWKRGVPPPMLQIFDAPNREKCVVERHLTNTPLQALALMNDPTFVEAARVLAERILCFPGSRNDKLEFAYRTVAARRPSKQELRILDALYVDAEEQFLANPTAAGKLTEIGETPANHSGRPTELAAWTIVVNVLFETDEFLTRP